MHDRRARRHAGLGGQPDRRQVPRPSRAVSDAAGFGLSAAPAGAYRREPLAPKPLIRKLTRVGAKKAPVPIRNLTEFKSRGDRAVV